MDTGSAGVDSPASIAALERCVAGLDWTRIAADLERCGYATIAGLLAPPLCAALTARWADEAGYRRHIVMERHGYGRGEYKYYSYPLPATVQALRSTFYARLAPIADRWHEVLRLPSGFPPEHRDYLARCHAAGQRRPTPLILRYGPDDYNRLHQDLYGEHVFPLQVAVLLSRPGAGFTGGEFVLTGQRARMQSQVDVVPLGQGDAVIFAVNDRPEAGARGIHRVRMRHGISRVRSGRRFTLGVIFHDAT